MKKKHWPPSISLVLPTGTIHSSVTNSQPLMESIKPCKYLQDKRASRQSIPIYRTMEGSTKAVFQVRKINKLGFGNSRQERLAVAPLSLPLTHFLLPSIILTLLLVPPFLQQSCEFDITGCTSQQVLGTAGSASSEVVGDSF